MKRQRYLAEINSGEEFDLCIIGGGASGAGAALDASLRGLRVLLIEKSDFASGTSSKSTKLIHGGVRYLEQAVKNLDFAQLKQVKHGLEERHTLLRIAPHLARPLGLITPVFSWWEGLYFSIGLRLYGLFAAKNDTLPSAVWLHKKQAVERFPNLTPRLHSAVLYYDGAFDDARFCLALVQAAAESGAAVLNHTELIDFQKSVAGKIESATFLDVLGGKTHSIRARAWLNCTGVAADSIRKMANATLAPRIRPSKGVHAVFPLHISGKNTNDGLLIPKTPDGRVVFAVPFQGAIMVGTTDEVEKEADKEPVLIQKEVEYLLETLKPYLAQCPKKEEVKAGFGGFRPLLIADAARFTKNMLRDHEVEMDDTSGLVSLLGGKWTTYRVMASDAVQRVCQILGKENTCLTAHHLLPGAADFSENTRTQLMEQYLLSEKVATHLSQNYGSRAFLVADLLQKHPTDAEFLVDGYPFIRAEVRYAARYEMAMVPRDFLARRVRLEILDWKACHQAVPMVAAIMAFELGYDTNWGKIQTTSYQADLEKWGRLHDTSFTQMERGLF